MEAAIIERVRRSPGVHLHHTLANAPLIYHPAGRAALRGLYEEYIEIAAVAGRPILLCTPTWRASRARVMHAATCREVNADAAHFMHELRAAHPHALISIGGMTGCANDCYRPEQGLPTDEAAAFHAWQIEQLADAGVDLLIAETLPNVNEALGVARAMADTALPYLLSFVIARTGEILDGTTLSRAVELIDRGTRRPPLGYMVNCAHPSFLCAARQPADLFTRLIGYQANASSLDHCDLERAENLQADPVDAWGDLMLDLHHTYGVRILGGCCGTGPDHLRYLA
jgi:S-methylmethionine-dependent homocysteine/selenocysteine methylase